MLVIVEGPDGSGKTTLVRKLREAALAPNVQFLSQSGRMTEELEVERYLTWLATRPIGLHLVLDRFPPISEWVYGRVLRGGRYFKNLYPPIGSIGDLIHRVKGTHSSLLVIHCRPSALRLEKDQMEGVVENIGGIRDTYDGFMLSLSKQMPVLDYDYNSVSVEELKEHLIKHLQQERWL